MTEQKHYTAEQIDQALYELYDLSVSEPEAFEFGSFELVGEDENGHEGSWECEVTDLASRSHSIIKQLQEEIATLKLDSGNHSSTETCKHNNGSTPIGYDESRCNDCGMISVGGSWGIASRMWFRNLEEAKFYRDNGRLPEKPVA